MRNFRTTLKEFIARLLIITMITSTFVVGYTPKVVHAAGPTEGSFTATPVEGFLDGAYTSRSGIPNYFNMEFQHPYPYNKLVIQLSDAYTGSGNLVPYLVQNMQSRSGITLRTPHIYGDPTWSKPYEDDWLESVEYDKNTKKVTFNIDPTKTPNVYFMGVYDKDLNQYKMLYKEIPSQGRSGFIKFHGYVGVLNISAEPLILQYTGGEQYISFKSDQNLTTLNYSLKETTKNGMYTDQTDITADEYGTLIMPTAGEYYATNRVPVVGEKGKDTEVTIYYTANACVSEENAGISWMTIDPSTNVLYNGTSVPKMVQSVKIKVVKDTTAPTASSITSTSNTKETQNVTLQAADNAGIYSYYWGKNSNPKSVIDGWTDLDEPTKNMTEVTEADSAGTWYFMVKDASDNYSTAKSITFYDTTLKVNGGTTLGTQEAHVITPAGQKFKLPEVLPDFGYSATSTWKLENGTSKKANEEYVVSKNSVVTATCPDEIITLQYNLNGGNIDGKTGTVTSDAKFSEEGIVFSKIPKRDGYTFTYWSEHLDGSGLTFDSGAAWKEAFTKNPIVTKVYAQWESIDYFFYYDLQGGTGISETEVSARYEQPGVVTSNTPSRAGAVFKGWYTSADGKGTRVDAGTNWKNKNSTDYFYGTNKVYAYWEEYKSTIDYFLQGGTLNGKTGTVTDDAKYSEEGKVIAGKPEKEGYKFINWNTQADGKGKGAEEGVVWKQEGTLEKIFDEFYAMWEELEYKLVYDLQEGTGIDTEDTKGYTKQGVVVTAEPQKAGSDFKGWYTLENGQGDFVSAGASWKDANKLPYFTKLYAFWKEHTRTIEYDLQGGTGVPESETVSYSNEGIVTNEIPVKPGYIFVNWNDRADGKGKGTEGGVTWKAGYSESVIYEKLYAIWEEKEYNFTYDLQEGTGIETRDSAKYTEDGFVTTAEPKRLGYRFVEWNTQADGNGTKVGAESKWKKASEDAYAYGTDKIYAIWAPGSYSITYDLQGGSCDAIQGETVDFETAGFVTNAVPTKEGYTFDYWNVLANGLGRDAAAGEEWKGANEEPEYDKLYAIWKENDYGFTYDLQGGTGVRENVSVKYTEPGTVTDEIPRYTGRQFMGWNTEPNGSGTMVSADALWKKASSEAYELGTNRLYAIWNIGVYSISYDLQGGSCDAIHGESKTFDEVGHVTTAVPTRTGYTFEYWNVKPDGQGRDVGGGEEWKVIGLEPSYDTLYAIWSENSYNFKYELEGGTDVVQNVQAKYTEPGIVTTAEPKKEGYKFIGWYTSADGKGDKIDGGEYWKEANSTEPVHNKLYAYWEVRTYNLHYDLNGAPGEISSDARTYLESGKVVTAEPKRTGYTFLYWNTQEDGQGMDVNGGDIWKQDFAVSTYDTLYAIWSENSYKFKYDLQGGKGIGTDVKSLFTEPGIVTSTLPSRFGYGFGGWYTSADGHGTKVEAGTNWKDPNSVDVKYNGILYAYWIEGLYTLSYDLQGGSPEIPAVTLPFVQQGVVTTSEPTRTGYTFLYWNTQEDGQGQDALAGEIWKKASEEALYDKLYAIWQENEYHFRYDLQGGKGLDVNDEAKYTEAGVVTTAEPEKEGYEFIGWYTSADGHGTKVEAGTNWKDSGSAGVKYDGVIYAKWHDIRPPENSFGTITTNIADTQTVTLKGTDALGITKYYFGTSENAVPDTEVASTKDFSQDIQITEPGTYYYILQNEVGNISTKLSVTFYKTEFKITNGVAAFYKLITKEGESFFVPDVTANSGYHIVTTDTWKIGNTAETIGNGEKYLPTDNFELTTTALPNELIYNGREVEIKSSAEPQYIDITEAANGTGNYVYSIYSQPNENYFNLVEGNTKIEIPADLPFGSYVVRIMVHDTDSEQEAIASYTINKTRERPEIKLINSSDSNIEITYPETKIINIAETSSNGEISVTSEDNEIATGEVIGNSITVIPGTKTGTTTLHVNIAATDFHVEADTVDINVTVNKGTFSITPTSVTAEANGTEHSALVRSSIDGVKLEYGTTENYEAGTIYDLGTEDTLMNRVSVIHAGPATTVYYRATKPGYNDVTGNATITVTDNTKPTGAITEVTNKDTNRQTLTLSASDNGKIKGFYFGTSENGVPEDLDAEVPMFTRERVEVTEAGNYYFRVADNKGNIETVATITFNGTTFTVNHGTTSLAARLTAAGSAFTLPNITAHEGYTAGTKWVVSGDSDREIGAVNAEYTPEETLDLVGNCEEITATLSYNNNGFGADLSGQSETMYYTVETTAAPKMENVPGHTFIAWNTESDGTGTTYEAGETVKIADKIPQDMTLYAIWSDNGLEFNNKSFTLNASLSDQAVEISSAANGTGSYKYEINDANKDYFDVSGDSEIVVAGGTPAGKYTVSVKATDNNTSAEATAIYSFKIDRIDASLTLSKDNLSMETFSSDAVEISKITDGAVTASISDPSIASVEVSGDSLIIKSRENNGAADITVKTAETGVYNATTKSCHVQVNNRTFTVEGIDVSADANGSKLSARISAGLDDVQVKYGVDGDYSHVMTLASADTEYELSDVSRTDWGTTKVTFIASKAGYDDVTGDATITIVDNEDPTGAITAVTNKDAFRQTLTLSASDNGKIAGYYFGLSEDGVPEDLAAEVPTFTREKVEVTKAGKYYFRVKDSFGNIKEVATITFYGTTFSVDENLGTPALTERLTASDNAFPAPAMTADTGYIAGTKWYASNDIAKTTVIASAGANYTPSETLDLKGYCDEITATLSYDRNGFGADLSGQSVTMSYTGETTAAPKMANVPGHTFIAWNTSADGSGITYEAGVDVVKAANEVPQDMTLYAIWSDNSLEFNNKSFTLNASLSDQAVEISAAANGTENYKYEVNDANKDYFDVSGNSEIVVAGGTPAGKYTVSVKATDNNTSAEATAIYSFKIDRIDANLSLQINVTMETLSSDTIAISKVTDGALSASISDPSIATVEVSGDSLIITSRESTGDAEIVVKSAQTGVYNETSASCHLKVNNRTFRVDGIDVSAEASKQSHCAKIKSSLPDVQVKYGVDGNYNHVMTITSAETEYDLTEVTRTGWGTTTVNFVASKAGYDDVTGNATITVEDTTNATGSITNVTNKLTDNQTVTLTASDDSGIKGYYFGKQSNGVPNDFTPVVDFERLKEVVNDGPGTYYFRVKDGANNVETVATIKFYKTTFTVEKGSTTLDAVLTASDNAFPAPAMTAENGYIAGTKWYASDDATKTTVITSANASYRPETSIDLKGYCDEITATLRYDSNGHDGATAGASTLYYTLSAEAAPGLAPVSGYTFKAWNTKPDGTGATFMAGEEIKGVNEIPKDMTLYAIWSNDSITFADQTIPTLTASLSDQAVDLTEATGGSGSFNYEVIGGTGSNHFTVSSDGKIHVEGGTPAGKYTVSIKATDTTNDETATAIYKFTLIRANASIAFAPASVSMTTLSAETVAVNKVTDGTVTAEIDDPTIASVEVSGNSEVIVKSKDVTGNATVTVKTSQTDVYNEKTETFTVNVANQSFTITPISCEATANDTPHYAKLKSSLAGVEIHYGTNGNYDNVLTLTSADTAYELTDVSRTEIGTTIVNYRASKAGYDDVTGTVGIHLTDARAPEISYTVTNDYAKKQTIEFTATDKDSGVAKYYFGTKATGELVGGDFIVATGDKKFVQSFEVSASGAYNFAVKDAESGLVTAIPEPITFSKTTLNVVKGSTTLEYVITENGKKFKLPSITPETGYLDTDEWVGAITYIAGSDYEVSSDATLTATCEEMTKTLTYDKNGHGDVTPAGGTMRYTEATSAASALPSVPGYTFAYWNTNADGTGKTFSADAQIKGANEIPEDMTLYAIWSVNDLVFANQSFLDLSTSENAQTVNIVSATDGTENYKYEVNDTNKDYFSVNDDNTKIIIKEKTPAGTYKVSVKATDTVSSAEATAIYTFTLARMNATLSLSPDDFEMDTLDEETVDIEKQTDGAITASIDNQNIATVSVSDDILTIKSKENSGDATITVKAAETDIYNETSASCHVKVNNRTFEIEGIDVEEDEDGQPYCALITASEPNVQVKYGIGNNLNHVMTLEEADTEYELSEVTRTEIGETTVNFIASKAGYDDESGSATIIINDSTAPEVTYDVTNDFSDEQTVTIKATDSGTGISKWYWGMVEPENYDGTGEGWHDISATPELNLSEKVNVGDDNNAIKMNGQNDYYFVVIDGNDNVTTLEEPISFVETDFKVTKFGSIKFKGKNEPNASVLTMIGYSFNLPEILAANNYVSDGKWFIEGDEEGYDVGSEYEPGMCLEFTTACRMPESTTLTYHDNGHGIAPAKVTMKTNVAVKAANGITGVPGFTFVAWNTKPDGSGVTYNPGDQIKKGGASIPDMDLYAIWSVNDLVFNGQSFNNLTTSLDAQSVNITAASNGTGTENYKYEINDANKDYFSVSDNSKIVLAPKTPAGSYTVSVKATDTVSSAEATAIYSFKLARMNASLLLSSDSVSIPTFGKEIVGISQVSDATNITATIDNQALASVGIAEGKLVINAKEASGTATIKLSIPETGIYTSASAECTLEVTKRDFVVTGIDVTANANEQPHYAKISANKPGVQVKYGEGTNLKHVMTLETSGEAYELKDVSRKFIGETTVNFVASLAGYNDVTGSAKITISDTEKPTGSITDITNNVANKQTVTINVMDKDQIVAYYFGKNPEGALKEISASSSFTKKKVEVSSDGTYYLIAKDNAGNKETVAEATFCKTTFTVENGATTLDEVLTYKGDGYNFKTPAMTASTGYKPGAYWSAVSGESRVKVVDVNTDYAPTQSLDLVGTCDECHATLSFDTCGHGVAPEDVEMYYTLEATAAPEVSAAGFSFLGWDTKADGMGNRFPAGATVKNANVIPEDMTLYAIWEENPLTFTGKSESLHTSSNAQTVAINPATNNVGTVEYTLDNKNDDKLSISGDSLVIAGNAPEGKYVATVRATDKVTGIYATATYTITLTKIDTVVTLGKSSVDMKTMSLESVSIDTLSDGEMTVKSDKPSVVNAAISGDSIELASNETTGSATIKLVVAETGVYNAATATLSVTVSQMTFVIEEVPVSAEADGLPHAALLKASVPGVSVRYGTSKFNLNNSVTLSAANTAVALSGEARTEVGTTEIFYKATKAGYATVEGSVTVIVVDTKAPELDRTTFAITGDESETQTFTFTVTDPSKVASYYVGLSDSPLDGDFTPIPAAKQSAKYAGSCELSAAGMYYIAAKDIHGNTTEVTELIEMCEITIEVEHGTASSNKLLAAIGMDIKTPTITPYTGYIAPAKWKNGNIDACKVGENVNVIGNTTLRAVCTEVGATLRYDSNGHVATAPADVHMTTSVEIKAASGLTTNDGYVFVSWNDQPDGTGTSYNPGSVVKASGDAPTDITLYAIWTKDDQKINLGKPRYSLTIGADLAVNFVFTLPAEYQGGEMTFTIDHDGGTQTVTGKTDTDGTTFKCKLNVNQMNDNITWVYNVGGKTAKSTEAYTFYRYLVNITNNYAGKYPDLAEFCTKLKTYGYYAQQFLAESQKKKPEDINHNLVPVAPVQPTVHSELQEFQMETSGSSINIDSTKIKRSLILDSTIALKFTIPMTQSCTWEDATLPTIKVNGQEVDPSNVKIKEGNLYVTTPGIAILNLEERQTVQIGNEFAVTASAMSYAQKLSEQTTYTFAKPLGYALYELCESAKYYAAKH